MSPPAPVCRVDGESGRRDHAIKRAVLDGSCQGRLLATPAPRRPSQLLLHSWSRVLQNFAQAHRSQSLLKRRLCGCPCDMNYAGRHQRARHVARTTEQGVDSSLVGLNHDSETRGLGNAIQRVVTVRTGIRSHLFRLGESSHDLANGALRHVRGDGNSLVLTRSSHLRARYPRIRMGFSARLVTISYMVSQSALQLWVIRNIRNSSSRFGFLLRASANPTRPASGCAQLFGGIDVFVDTPGRSSSVSNPPIDNRQRRFNSVRCRALDPMANDLSIGNVRFSRAPMSTRSSVRASSATLSHAVGTTVAPIAKCAIRRRSEGPRLTRTKG